MNIVLPENNPEIVHNSILDNMEQNIQISHKQNVQIPTMFIDKSTKSSNISHNMQNVFLFIIMILLALLTTYFYTKI